MPVFPFEHIGNLLSMCCVVVGKRVRPIQAEKLLVHFLYQIPAFGAFDDFDDFLESISCESSKPVKFVVRIHAGEPPKIALSILYFAGDPI
jgi:hypothetical protein